MRRASERRWRRCGPCSIACARPGVDIDTLSMGMSADLESAVLEGSTMVRIGTAIFGERERKQP